MLSILINSLLLIGLVGRSAMDESMEHHKRFGISTYGQSLPALWGTILVLLPINYFDSHDATLVVISSLQAALEEMFCVKTILEVHASGIDTGKCVLPLMLRIARVNVSLIDSSDFSHSLRIHGVAYDAKVAFLALDWVRLSSNYVVPLFWLTRWPYSSFATGLANPPRDPSLTCLIGLLKLWWKDHADCCRGIRMIKP